MVYFNLSDHIKELSYRPTERKSCDLKWYCFIINNKISMSALVFLTAETTPVSLLATLYQRWASSRLRGQSFCFCIVRLSVSSISSWREPAHAALTFSSWRVTSLRNAVFLLSVWWSWLFPIRCLRLHSRKCCIIVFFGRSICIWGPIFSCLINATTTKIPVTL